MKLMRPIIKAFAVLIGLFVGTFLFVQFQTGTFTIESKPTEDIKTSFNHDGFSYFCEEAIEGSWDRSWLLGDWTWEPNDEADISKNCSTTGYSGE